MTTRTPVQHGERRCYLRGCRRDECVTANKRYCKSYRVETLHQPIRIDAEPVATHLDNLAGQGYSHRQIATAANRNTGEISKLRLRQQLTITPALAQTLLRVRLNGVTPHHAMVDATGTVRRGQALYSIGHPIYAMAAAIPMACNGLGRMLAAPPATVRLTVANGMADLYTQLRWKPGTSVRSPIHAARNGWHGPLAWDGNIDDPDAVPEASDPYAPTSRFTRDPYRRGEMEHLARAGASADEIRRRTGASQSYTREVLAELRIGQRRDRKAAA
ncbi:hypothetical protein ACWHA3_02335 [Streptomyces cyaneofuscatus]